MINKIVYSIIVPLYNEELVIDESYRRLKAVMDSTKENYEIIFINDGSRDSTKEKADNICKRMKNKACKFFEKFWSSSCYNCGNGCI